MYKKISLTIIMASAIATILIVPWAALQRSHAQSDLSSTILDIHNRERAAVGVPALQWSDSLAADAKGWADHLVQLNEGKPIDEAQLVHATGTGQGENLASRSAWGSGPVSPPSTGSLLQGWVNEKSSMGGHYTQMVWKNTKEVGCATATVNGKASDARGGYSGVVVYLVCRYSPPGNIAGERPF
jgi:pathogenesis-related protein 1